METAEGGGWRKETEHHHVPCLTQGSRFLFAVSADGTIIVWLTCTLAFPNTDTHTFRHLNAPPDDIIASSCDEPLCVLGVSF